METLQNGVFEAVRHLFIPLILPALVISTVVVAIGMAKKARKKSVLLALPASIGTTTWATAEDISSTHVIGLLVLVLFMWLVYITYEWSARYTARYEKLRILAAIVVGVVAYVSVAYCVMNALHPPFAIMTATAFVLWIPYRLWDMRQPPHEEKVQLAGTLAKGLIVLPIALVMLALQDMLAGVVVTFPYIAVFAAFERRGDLYDMLTGFCRYLPNILAFFVVVHVLQDVLPPLSPRTWATFGVVVAGGIVSLLVLTALQPPSKDGALPRFPRWSKDAV